MGSVVVHMTVSLFIRLAMLFLGEEQDKHFDLKYTDIDYHVFTDAANAVVQGGSPYDRHTYRYTPLLAWILTPNILWNFIFGKLLFVLLDVFCGYLVFKFVSYELEKDQKNLAMYSSLLYLYNPIPIVICTRGSAESLVSCLILATLFFLQRDLLVLSGIFYAVAVHFKIYPIIYILPLYITMGQNGNISSLFNLNSKRLKFLFSFSFVFGCLTWFYYSYYGMKFLEETYFYHIFRKDTRHNFSLYFYMMYLSVEFSNSFISILPFIMQLVVLIGISWRFKSKEDLAFCLFTQTVVFVTFNKVVTSQYFLWYLCLLPLCLPKLKMNNIEALSLIVIWFFGQASWLLPAYYLEYEGRNTFLYIWIESIAFFCSNLGILGRIVKSYH